MCSKPAFLEATGVPNLNTQSPSERCDGDCALSLGEPLASRLRLGRARNKPIGQSPLPVNRRDAPARRERFPSGPPWPFSVVLLGATS